MMAFLRPYGFTALVLFVVPAFHCPAATGEHPNRVLTLVECMERGLAANGELKAAQDKIFQADQVRRRARTEFLPEFAMTYGYQKTDAPEAIDLDLPRSGPLHLEVSGTDNFKWVGTVTQPLFKGFGIIGNYRRAVLGVDRARADTELEKIDLALRVKQAYFNVLVSEKLVQVAEQAVTSLTAHFKNAESFYELEMIPPNKLLEVEVELGSAEYERVRAVNASRQSRAALNTLLSLPVDAPVILEDVLSFLPVDENYDDCVSRALEQRPEIRSIQLGILQVDQEIIMARSKMYPEIGLQYRQVKEGDSFDVTGSRFHDPNGWEISAALNWVLWQWGKTRHSVAEKKSRRDELLNLKKALEDNIRLEVKSALLELDQAEANVPRAARSVELGEENLRVSRERFAARAAASTEVLDAQTLLTRAKSDYFHAVYDHNLAKAALKRALGTY
ncbi:MAG: TolC family protein [Desulfobacterales bacterium]|nr:TolC family protein [Desulfobacterales bacterium]